MPQLRLPTARGRAAARPLRAAVTPCASRVAEPALLSLKTVEGDDKGSASLALKVADPKTARHVVHRYLVTVRQNARQGNACTKTRGEVSGGGRKPLKQKGTGQARKGSSRTPLRPGGGISFGPKPRDWSKKMNKKERRLAMGTALQSASGDMVVVDSFEALAEEPKTRTLVQMCKNIGVDVMQEHALIITHGENGLVQRCGKNVARLQVNRSDGLSVYEVLRADRIIIEEPALQAMHERYC